MLRRLFFPALLASAVPAAIIRPKKSECEELRERIAGLEKALASLMGARVVVFNEDNLSFDTVTVGHLAGQSEAAVSTVFQPMPMFELTYPE